MAIDSIAHSPLQIASSPPTSPQNNTNEKFTVARRVQDAKDDQQQAIQKKRAALEDKQQADERVEKARAEELKARENVRKAVTEKQQVARKNIDIVV